MRIALHAGAAAAVGLAALIGNADVARAQASDLSPTRDMSSTAGDARNYFVREDGGRLLFDPVYYDWFGKPRERHFLRTSAEEVGLLAALLGYYWLKADSNTEDWDYPSFKQRFLNLEAVRFDNNMSTTNFVIHPLAGALYYNLGRVNGLSVYESFAVSAGASALYEWWLEWLEKVSINDLVFTPGGGWAPGEFFFKLESYFNSAPAGGAWGNRALMYSLGAPVRLHNDLDDIPPPMAIGTDSLGFSSAYWHQFDVGYAFAAIDNELGRSGYVHDVNIRAKLYAMPGFLQPGRIETSFSDGNFNDVDTRMSFGNEGWADVDLLFSTDYAGYYFQDLELGEEGVTGHAALAAFNTSARYVQRWLLGRRDMWAFAHLLGPDFRYWFLDGPFRAELEASFHGDAAGIRSLPFNEWEHDFGASGTKSVLQNHSYYFALGTSGRFSAKLRYGGAELGSRLFVGVYDSVDVLDREQDTVTRNVHERDQLLEAGAWFGYTIPGAPVHFGVDASQTFRRSQMPPLVAHQWDRRVALELGLRF